MEGGTAALREKCTEAYSLPYTEQHKLQPVVYVCVGGIR